MRAQADPFQDERHDRLVLVAPVALARDPRVAPADRAARWSGGHERRARLEVAVAVLVTDEPTAAGGALEHRQGIGPARLGPPRRAALPYQGAKSNSTDVQWHTTPNLTDAGKIKLGTTTYRLVTGHLSYTDVYNGMTLCKYGKTTGYDCGEVTSIGYLPRWISPSSPYFGRLTNRSLDMSTEGDFGGPIFRNGSAVGLTSGFDGANIFCEDENIFGFLYPFATNALDIGVIIGG